MALPGMAANVSEWPGAAPSKFSDPQTGRPQVRQAVPTYCGHGSTLGQKGMAGFFTDTAGLVPTEGKRNVHIPPSEVAAWRPARRALSEPGAHNEVKQEGLRMVQEPLRSVYRAREKRHIQPAEPKVEAGDVPSGIRQVYRGNGLRAIDQPAHEVDVGQELQSKSRPLHPRLQRNGIGCCSLGDKPYRHPEYASNFHKAGALIVGSSFTRGHYKKTEPRNNISLEVLEADKHMKSHAEKMAEMRQKVQDKLRDAAEAEVARITLEWEGKTLKENKENKESNAAYVNSMEDDDEIEVSDKIFRALSVDGSDESGTKELLDDGEACYPLVPSEFISGMAFLASELLPATDREALVGKLRDEAEAASAAENLAPIGKDKFRASVREMVQAAEASSGQMRASVVLVRLNACTDVLAGGSWKRFGEIVGGVLDRLFSALAFHSDHELKAKEYLDGMAFLAKELLPADTVKSWLGKLRQEVKNLEGRAIGKDRFRASIRELTQATGLSQASSLAKIVSCADALAEGA